MWPGCKVKESKSGFELTRTGQRVKFKGLKMQLHTVSVPFYVENNFTDTQ